MFAAHIHTCHELRLCLALRWIKVIQLFWSAFAYFLVWQTIFFCFCSYFEQHIVKSPTHPSALTAKWQIKAFIQYILNSAGAGSEFRCHRMFRTGTFGADATYARTMTANRAWSGGAKARLAWAVARAPLDNPSLIFLRIMCLTVSFCGQF